MPETYPSNIDKNGELNKMGKDDAYGSRHSNNPDDYMSYHPDESVRDTDKIVSEAKDPEKKSDEPQRNEETYRICQNDGMLVPRNEPCPRCGATLETEKHEYKFQKWRYTGSY